MSSETTTYTSLYYKKDTIFNICVVQSTYRARSLKAPDGKSSFEEYAMTDNDRDLFNQVINGVASEVFQPMSVLSQGVPNGIRLDADIADVGKCIAYQVYLPDGFDDNQIIALDTNVLDALVAGMLAKWYENVQLSQVASEQSNKFDQLIKKIRSGVLYSTTRTKVPYRIY
jgi:hypothetical protein